MVDCYYFIFYPQQVHQHTHVCISFFFFINFYWSTVALQCYVSFYYTEKWISHTCTYMYPFWTSFPFRSPQTIKRVPCFISCRLWGRRVGHDWSDLAAAAVLYCRFSLVIYFMHRINSVYVSIPISQFLPLLPSPLGRYPLFWRSLFSRSVVSDSLWRQASLSCTISQSLFRLMSLELVMPSNHLKVVQSFTVSWQAQFFIWVFLVQELRNSADSLQASLLRTEMCGQEADLITRGGESSMMSFEKGFGTSL